MTLLPKNEKYSQFYRIFFQIARLSLMFIDKSAICP